MSRQGELNQAVVVRRSRPEDARALAAIAWSIVTAYGLPEDLELLAYGAPGRNVIAELCAEVDGEAVDSEGVLSARRPVGTVTLSVHPHDRDAGWVSKFFVDPLARGRGIGKALHRALLVEAHKAGMLRLELSTLTVFREAIALYEANGWKKRRFARGIERRYVLTIAE